MDLADAVLVDPIHDEVIGASKVSDSSPSTACSGRIQVLNCCSDKSERS